MSREPAGEVVEQNTFETALESFNVALERLLHGDAAPVRSLWSTADDITLANPYGPPCRGPVAVGRAIEAAAGQYRGGSRRFEELSRFAVDDLGYVVQIEHTTARAADDGRSVSFALRVTMVLRREHGRWQVVHRHADPLTGDRSLSAFAST
jgi:ketosteroid isomerase-like protein